MACMDMEKLQTYGCLYAEKCKKFKNNECDKDSCIKLFKIKKLQSMALLSEGQTTPINLYLDSDKIDLKPYTRLKEIQNNITDFVNKGENLFIYSGICGNGKTTWSIKLLNSYFETIWYNTDLICRGLFINVPRFLISLKDNIGAKVEWVQYAKENILTADIVVWDDIATKGFTEYEMENLLSLINYRIENRLANIYTSNVSGELLRDCIGDRLFSRVYNKSDVIEFKGKDKRGLKQ